MFGILPEVVFYGSLLVVYLMIGAWIGRRAWGVWFDADADGSWTSLFLFPWSHSFDIMGDSAPINWIGGRLATDDGRGRYVFLLMFFWPVKVIWNAIIFLPAVILSTCWNVFAKRMNMMAVGAYARRIRPKKAHPVTLVSTKAAPVEDDPNEELEEKLCALIEKRRLLDDEIRTLQMQLTQKHGSGSFPRYEDLEN